MHETSGQSYCLMASGELRRCKRPGYAGMALCLDPCNHACSNLCNGGVNTLLQWDTSAVYRLAALQSTAGP